MDEEGVLVGMSGGEWSMVGEEKGGGKGLCIGWWWREGDE